MYETEYASQRNCHFDDSLYADDGFIAELLVSYRTENLRNSCYRTENHEVFHFSQMQNWTIFKAELTSVKRRFSVATCEVWL